MSPCKRGHVEGRNARGQCLECKRLWRQNNVASVSASRARWEESNPEHRQLIERRQSRRRKGIASDEQRTGPCENPGCSFVGALCLDHDHATGALRGWLCQRCNCALGLLDDTAARAEGLAAYLRRPLP